MKRKSLIAALALGFLLAAGRPSWANKQETYEMMQQLDTLQQLVTQLQQTVASQLAVLKTLVQQNSDAVNRMQRKVDSLERATRQTLASDSNQMNSINQQVEALSSSLDDAKAEISKLSDQVAKTQNILQTLNQPAQPQTSATMPGATTGALAPGTIGGPSDAPPGSVQTPNASSIPDADSLYSAAVSAYAAAQYKLAIQGFEEYLQYYGTTDRASNAQFYIGECYYVQHQYHEAIEAYNLCMQQYPGGNKARDALLRKAECLIHLGERAAGEEDLRLLIRRAPQSREAMIARQKLNALLGSPRR